MNTNPQYPPSLLLRSQEVESGKGLGTVNWKHHYQERRKKSWDSAMIYKLTSSGSQPLKIICLWICRITPSMSFIPRYFSNHGSPKSEVIFHDVNTYTSVVSLILPRLVSLPDSKSFHVSSESYCLSSTKFPSNSCLIFFFLMFYLSLNE